MQWRLLGRLSDQAENLDDDTAAGAFGELVPAVADCRDGEQAAIAEAMLSDLVRFVTGAKLQYRELTL